MRRISFEKKARLYSSFIEINAFDIPLFFKSVNENVLVNIQRNKFIIMLFLTINYVLLLAAAIHSVASQNKNNSLSFENEASGICQRKYIRNNPSNLELLRGCSVIEGSLQLALMRSNSPKKWENYSYPELREITGYLLIFDINNLPSLQNLFPNLAVIRGQELVSNNALIISSGNELQEIGLSSLTTIQRGNVWIVGNAQLCNAEYVDWRLIANQSTGNVFANNRPIDQCLDHKCNKTCPTSQYDNEHLCWGERSCQKVFSSLCPSCNGSTCTSRGECCSGQCLGGCFGTNPEQCYVCKNVRFNNTCMDECPPDYYEYLERRCVTREQCLKTESFPDVSKGFIALLHGKLYEAPNKKKRCVLECPKDSELNPNKTVCVPNKGPDTMNCPGMQVNSIEKARELTGCTRITGVLTISIRKRPSKNNESSTTAAITKVLTQSLGKIEEIDGYLSIRHSPALFSLEFLKNLRIIHGMNLEAGKYALVVWSNDNLIKLWEDHSVQRNITIGPKYARVLFHHNPRLCPAKIWDFVAQSGIHQQQSNGSMDEVIDIGITNGDKVTCNTHILKVEVEKKSSHSALVKYENFRKYLVLTSRLLSYEIYYKEAVNYTGKNVSKYHEDNDENNDGVWTVLEYPKMSDSHVPNLIEPFWEHSRLITDLKQYTWYALYVKAIMIPSESSRITNNNTGAESSILYFRTLPSRKMPKPEEFTVVPEGPDVVSLSWSLPIYPIKQLEKFIIWLKPIKVSQDENGQTEKNNYCNKGRIARYVTTGKPVAAERVAAPKTTAPPSYEVNYDEIDMMDEILSHVFIAQPVDYDTKLNEHSPRNDMIFNEGSSSVEMNYSRILREMVKVSEIRSVPGQLKYSYRLKNLTHFTTYEIGLQACRFTDERKVSTESYLGDLFGHNEANERACSDLVMNTVETKASLTADVIDERSVSANVTNGGKLHLTWEEPRNPNGRILAYVVKVQKVSDSNATVYPIVRHCITQSKFHDSKNLVTLPDNLSPGNYSILIQVVSMFTGIDSTRNIFVLIDDIDDDDTVSMGSWFWVLMIVLSILFTIAVAILLSVLYNSVFAKKRKFGMVTSANPEYIPGVDIPEEWEVPTEKLTVFKKKKLGEGSFGTVFLGLLKDHIDGQPSLLCAVKTLSADNSSCEGIALFLKEAASMVKLDCHCNHIVRLLGIVSKSQPMYVIMELMSKGDLKNYLRSKRPGGTSDKFGNEPPPTLRQVLRMAAEIADGMAYIHKHNLVHRDLAARNCMVGDDLRVKVGDFGMTKEMLQSDYYRKRTRECWPVRWMAPESLCDGIFSTQTDVWSFGIVLWEMATLASRPYQELNNKEVKKYVASGYTMERPENCPNVLFHLMTSCWQTEPRLRPNFIQIIERLLIHLDQSSFAQVSFFHSRAGLEYQKQLKLKSLDDAMMETKFDSTHLPLLEDDVEDDFDDSSDEEDELSHVIVDDLGEIPSRIELPDIMTSSRKPRSSMNRLHNLVIHPQADKMKRDSCDGNGVSLDNLPSNDSGENSRLPQLPPSPPPSVVFSSKQNQDANDSTDTGISSVSSSK